MPLERENEEERLARIESMLAAAREAHTERSLQNIRRKVAQARRTGRRTTDK